MSTPDSAYRVRLLDESEIDALHALSVACFAERANSATFIRSRYFSQTGPQADVVVVDDAGSVVAAQTVTYLPFLLRGEPVFAGMFTDGMTHPEHRRRGLFRMAINEAERLAFEKQVAFLFTMPNDESLPAFERSDRWRVLPDRRLLVRPINWGGVLRDRGVPGWISGLMGLPIDLVLKARGRLSDAVTEVDDVSELVTDLDLLASRSTVASSAILCRRDAGFLHWRFFENPTFAYRCFVHHGSNGVNAYCITTTEQRMGTTIGYAVDFLWSDTEAMDTLFQHVAERLRESGVRLFGAIVSSSQQVEALKRCGFRDVNPKFTGRAFHTAYAPNPAQPQLATQLDQPDDWLLSLADFDTI